MAGAFAAWGSNVDDPREEPVSILSCLVDDFGNPPPTTIQRPRAAWRSPSSSSDDDDDDIVDPIWEPTTLVPDGCEAGIVPWRDDEQEQPQSFSSSPIDDEDVDEDEEENAYVRLMQVGEASDSGADSSGSVANACADDDDDAAASSREEEEEEIHRSPYFSQGWQDRMGEGSRQRKRARVSVPSAAEVSCLEDTTTTTTTTSEGPGAESSAYDDMLAQPPPPRQRPRLNPAPPQRHSLFDRGDDDDDEEPQGWNGRRRTVGRVECSPCDETAQVWCFGCMWGATGYRPVDNEKIRDLVDEFRDLLLSGMPTIANIGIRVARQYEKNIRQPSMEAGHYLPQWPAWSVERHIRNIREPQIRQALMLEGLMAVVQEVGQHVVVRDARSGARKLHPQNTRVYYAGIKQWCDLSRMDPAACCGYNADFRADPSRYATLVDARRIAAPRGRSDASTNSRSNREAAAAASSGDRVGRPHFSGAPVAALPGQRGARGPAYTRSGADTGEMRIPGNNEALVRRRHTLLEAAGASDGP